MKHYQTIKKSLFLLVLFTVFLSCKSTQIVDYGNNPKAGKFHKVRDLNIYTEEYGEGKPLVLLHGNGGSISFFSKIIPILEKKYHVIALDSRAHGKTIDTKDSLDFKIMADDVSALLDNMKIPSAYVIGWSDGGIISLELAMRHPEKVIKLASTGANISTDASALIPGLWEESKKHYDENKNLPKTTEKEKQAWKHFLLNWLYPNISVDELQKITTPSLIISGDRDLISLEHTLFIYRNIPKAQLWVLPNASHGTLIEYPEEFCEKVDAFFEE